MKKNKLYALLLIALMAVSAHGETVTLQIDFDDYPNDISFQMRLNDEVLEFDAAASSTEGTSSGDGFHGGFGILSLPIKVSRSYGTSRRATTSSSLRILTATGYVATKAMAVT